MKPLALAAALAIFAGAALAYDGEHYVTCNLDPNGDNWVALKAAPSLNSKRLMRLGPDTYLVTLDPYPQGKWRQVIVQRDAQAWDYNGPQGWVYTDYICEIRY